jgi:hypothetical protein
MSAPEDTHRDVDIAALYARLQDEVVRTRRGLSGTAGLRDIAERTWAVSADRPLCGDPTRGALASGQEAPSPVLRWYVAHAQEQREFNEAILQLVDEPLERPIRRPACSPSRSATVRSPRNSAGSSGPRRRPRRSRQWTCGNRSNASTTDLGRHLDQLAQRMTA